MSADCSRARPGLILYLTSYEDAQKNAVAATLAWIAERDGRAFEVYYDAAHAGRHYGGSASGAELALLTGGPISGGRHLEAVGLALQRFQTTVITCGTVAFSGSIKSLAEETGAQVLEVDGTVSSLYDAVFSALGLSWPDTAVMLNAAPSPELDGIDAYCYPEIFYRRVLGIEASTSRDDLGILLERGVRRMLTCGVPERQQEALRAAGFHVSDLGVVCDGDDYASVTYRLAKRWEDRRAGWIVGDPVVTAYWLPTACRERRSAIYSVPQSRVIGRLEKEIEANTSLVLGRQYEDGDFFALSRLGQSFQVIDPCRPALPVLQTLPSRWADVPDPCVEDPSDAQLREWASQGRILTSLVFWTGMIRETENLYALMDLFALTGLRAGIVLTSESFTWRPSPLDLLVVPQRQGGVYPNVEVLLGSCGTGVAIESELTAERLAQHLCGAQGELERLGVPRSLRPQGWWATMDAQLLPRAGRWDPPPIRRRTAAPFIALRYHARTDRGSPEPIGECPAVNGHHEDSDRRLREWLRRPAEQARRRVRDSRLRSLFEPYRPYEHLGPGPIAPEIANAVRQAGFSYMLTKSGFGDPPRVMYRDGDFVALNYTAGQWDGWTPFETINHVRDLRRAEKVLLARRQPGWLLGGIDACLWALSGELWDRAPGLAEIARFTVSGGISGRLVNVPPRVLARYARLLSETDQSLGAESKSRVEVPV